MRISWFLNKEIDDLVKRGHLLDKESLGLDGYSFVTKLEEDNITPFSIRAWNTETNHEDDRTH